MSLSFRSQPGYWERHLARRYHNPLFARQRREVDTQELSAARRRDNDELETFQRDFKELLEQAAGLASNVDSDVVLSIKERADRLYEHSIGLAADLATARDAMSRLVEAIMRAVNQGASGDPRALDELAQEREARALHYALLHSVLIADLLRPDTPVEQQDLVPSLLSAAAVDLERALRLFDDEQLTAVLQHAQQLVAERLAEGVVLPDAVTDRLHDIESALAGRGT